MSIGDEGEIKLTAIKIAQLFGAIFSNTEILKPIRKGDIPGTINHFPYPDIMREKVQEALRLTITDGTLKTIQLQNSSIQILGGKTGTPTQEGKKFHTHGWNILYFKKADTPFLLVVFTKNGSGKKEAIALSTIILNLI